MPRHVVVWLFAVMAAVTTAVPYTFTFDLSNNVTCVPFTTVHKHVETISRACCADTECARMVSYVMGGSCAPEVLAATVHDAPRTSSQMAEWRRLVRASFVGSRAGISWCEWDHDGTATQSLLRLFTTRAHVETNGQGACRDENGTCRLGDYIFSGSGDVIGLIILLVGAIVSLRAVYVAIQTLNIRRARHAL